MSWTTVKLGTIAKLVTGKTPPTGQSEFFDGGVLWINPSDFTTKYLSESKRTLTEEAISSKKCNLLPKGTVLISCIGDIGKAGILDDVGTSNQQITGLVLCENILPEYIYYVILYSKAKLEKLANKAVVAILNNDRLKELEIPLPPLPIQKKIADILDAADALRRKDEELLKKYDELAQAIFIDMFGDPVKNEKGWIIRKLESLIHPKDKINYGVVQPGADTPNGTPVVRIGDFENMTICKNNLKRISPEIEKAYSRSRLMGDEILVACVGATIGKIALVDEGCKGFNIVRATARIRLDEKVANKLYIGSLLSTNVIQEYFIKETRTVSQPTLNISHIENTPILCPPIEMQRRYAMIVSNIQYQKSRILHQQAQSDAMFQTLLQKAYKGELVKEEELV